jgi:hypothetical protein
MSELFSSRLQQCPAATATADTATLEACNACSECSACKACEICSVSSTPVECSCEIPPVPVVQERFLCSVPVACETCSAQVECEAPPAPVVCEICSAQVECKTAPVCPLCSPAPPPPVCQEPEPSPPCPTQQQEEENDITSGDDEATTTEEVHWKMDVCFAEGLITTCNEMSDFSPDWIDGRRAISITSPKPFTGAQIIYSHMNEDGYTDLVVKLADSEVPG